MFEKEATRYLNLGCGSRYHPDWINMDIASHSPEVIQHDLNQGVPLPSASCDIVYHAAVLEHMRRLDAVVFMVECFRVLKVGGIVRVGVPDLEKICRLYLYKLETALLSDEDATHDYEWIMLELFDQIVREKGGGVMVDYLRQNPMPNEKFVYDRIGVEGRELVNTLRSNSVPVRRNSHSLQALLGKFWKGFSTFPDLVKHRIIFWLLGAESRRAHEIGRFRLTGEVHQWMYDRYSLARLLKKVGFHDPQVKDARTSQIPNWTNFNLDTLPDGSAIKPDLFFMEAIKPGVDPHD